MALHIAFEKSTDSLLKKLVKFVAGPYVHTELIITQAEFDDSGKSKLVHTGYSTFMRETFSRIFQKDFWYDDQCHDFLSIPVSPEELYRLSKSCEACVESKIPYNAADMVLSQIPLRNPTDRELYQSKTLFCSQAAVLLLRACLDEEHVLQGPLALVNSRTVTPSHLYEIIKPFCPQRSKMQALGVQKR
jgi:hypothetical protein